MNKLLALLDELPDEMPFELSESLPVEALDAWVMNILNAVVYPDNYSLPAIAA